MKTDLLNAVLDACELDWILVVSCGEQQGETIKFHNGCNSQGTGVHHAVMSAPLRELLKLKKDDSFNGKCYELVCGGDDGECSGKCKVSNARGELNVFRIKGHKVHKSYYVFRLEETAAAATEDHVVEPPADSIVDELFTNTVMGVIEVRGNKWRNIAANKYTAALNCPLLSGKGSISDNIKILEGCSECKKSGKISTVVFDRYLPFNQLNLSYIGKSKNTNGARFSYIGFDLVTEQESVYQLHSRIRELEEFFVNAPVMMGIVDRENNPYSHKIIFANEMFCRAYMQVPNTGLTMKSVLEGLQKGPAYIYDSWLSGHLKYDDLYLQSRKQTQPIQSELSLASFDQSVREESIYHVVVSCLSQNPEVSRHAFMMMDITKQRKAEQELAKYRDNLEEKVILRTQELQDSEERFKSLVANAPNIILTINRNGLILYANRAFKGKNETLVGQELQAVIKDGADFVDKIKHMFDTGLAFQTEGTLLDKTVWLNLSVGRVNDKVAIVVATDISEIKQLSEELHRAVTTKTRFLANMSHEIRTPLSGIIGMSRLLAETGLTLDQAECVATILWSGETLLSVINDVLDYSKLEANGGMTLAKEDLSLQQILEESLYTALPSTQKKGIELILDIEPNIPDWVVIDGMRLRQILVNLLNNSVKFTSTGYIMLSVSLNKPFILDGDMSCEFCISVKDTGCGVAKDNQSKLFQMFSQVDSSSTRRFGGTGIGLALARKLVELMGGKIWMESPGIDGGGSIFSFTLPAEIATSAHPVLSLTPNAFTPSTEVIILDKTEVAREALRRRLIGKGFANVSTYAPSVILDDVHECSSESHQLLLFVGIDGELKIPKVSCPFAAFVFMGASPPKVVPTLSPPRSASPPRCSSPIFEFSRKPMKDASIVRCVNSIAQRLHKTSTMKSPPTPSIKPACEKVCPLKILVVEDNEVNQKVIRKMLHHLGHTAAVVAGNGQEALDIINETGLPDIIFMDVQMPIMDGVECTRVIRKKYGNEWPYIASMTADAFPEDRQICLEAGMNTFLTKPIRLEQVVSTIEECHLLKALGEPEATQ